MVDTTDIQNTFKGIGLSQQESQLYVDLLRNGPQTVMQLSKRADIPRSTIYRIIETLVEEGFVEKVLKKKTSVFKAVPSDNLDFLVTEQENKLNDLKSTMEAIKDMGLTSLQNVPTTQVRHYQGVSGIKQMLWNSLNADKEVIGYSEFGRVDVVGTNFYNSFVKEFDHRNLSDRVITNETGFKYVEKHVLSTVDKHQLGIEGIKVLPEERFYVAGDTSIYNNIYSVSFWKGDEIVGVEIENPEMVRLHKSIFEILWDIASPYGEVN